VEEGAGARPERNALLHLLDHSTIVQGRQLARNIMEALSPDGAVELAHELNVVKVCRDTFAGIAPYDPLAENSLRNIVIP